VWDAVCRVPTLRRPPYLNNVGVDIFPNKLVKMYALVAGGEKVLIGGNFRFVNDAAALGIAALDAVNGSVDDSFAARVEAPGGVLALARQPDGKLVIGGEFAYAGDLPRNNLARMNVDGRVDRTWYPDTDGAGTDWAANQTRISGQGL